MDSGRLIKDLLREDVEDASKLLGLALNKTQEQLFANLEYKINNSEFKKFLSLSSSQSLIIYFKTIRLNQMQISTHIS